jgi:maltooligosyltrehalose trehalohydrolase
MPAFRSSSARRGDCDANTIMRRFYRAAPAKSLLRRIQFHEGMGSVKTDSMKTDAKVNLMNGAVLLGDGRVEFRLWAPSINRVTLKLWRNGQSEPERFSMRRLGSADFGMPDLDEPDAETWMLTTLAAPGDLYQFEVGELSVPDPVSRHLPEGVHGRTEIVDPERFVWTDHHWHGIPLEHYVIYELHVGTFTPDGTFDSAIEKLDHLRELGITAIEVMPVNAFPGDHNWGYDGVGLYAVQNSYGGPEAFRRFVNEAHRRGLAVLLDVVYNHLGNEGNYLSQFGPYFTEKHQTPWGSAVNYDDEGCAGVRRFVVENALHWIREYHLDGLRLDATQTIKDDSEVHIVREIAEQVHELASELQRTVVVTCETDENDSKYVLPANEDGFGVDAVWSDDFHHAVHVLLTRESFGYYQDFSDPKLLTRALSDGYAFQGEHFRYWKDRRGTSAEGIPLPTNIICIQNHDQIGNRAKGERLSALIPRGAHKMLAAILLLAPHTPLLFQGEEYGEENPFQFFTDYGDPHLQKAVSEGRRSEFKDFDFSEVPDPQDRETFERSRLTWATEDRHHSMLAWYKNLLRIRHEFVSKSKRTCRAEWIDQRTLKMQVPADDPKLLVAASFAGELRFDPGSEWEPLADSNENNFSVRIWHRAA